MPDLYQLRLTQSGADPAQVAVELLLLQADGDVPCPTLSAQWLSDTWWQPRGRNAARIAWPTPPVQAGQTTPCRICVRPGSIPRGSGIVTCTNAEGMTLFSAPAALQYMISGCNLNGCLISSLEDFAFASPRNPVIPTGTSHMTAEFRGEGAQSFGVRCDWDLQLCITAGEWPWLFTLQVAIVQVSSGFPESLIAHALYVGPLKDSLNEAIDPAEPVTLTRAEVWPSAACAFQTFPVAVLCRGVA